MSIFDAYDQEFKALTNEIGSDISSIKSTPENANTLIKKGKYLILSLLLLLLLLLL